MSEWWKYTISDFLMFSPRAYYRMIERYNEAVWPAQLVTLGLGLVIAWLLWRSGPRQGRVVSGVLAALWAWVAWAYLWKRYATINWTATYVAWAFAIEVALLVGLGVVRGSLSLRRSGSIAGVAGVGLLALSLAVYPLIAVLAGRGWRQTEVFGITPDPTAIATIGLLLLAEGRARWPLLVVPVLWCLFSGATQWAMGSVGSG